jgi:hypothetical protein
VKLADHTSRLILQNSGAHSLRSGPVTTAVKRGVTCSRSIKPTKNRQMLRAYCRDAELFVGNAAAGLL